MEAVTGKTYAGYEGGQELHAHHTHNDSNSTGVSWPAVIAGGFVTAALVLILLALGAGLGLSAVSPWSNSGVSTATIGRGAIAWLIFMELVSASMGGYLAGRLRTKWVTVHTDEVYFRDTAHGFLAWSVALVISAAFLGTAATSLVGSAASAPEATRTQNGAGQGANAYFVDELFRAEGPRTEAAGTSAPVMGGGQAANGEAALIFEHGLKDGALPEADKAYLDQMVSARTGLSRSDADSRVSAVFADAQKVAEEARKAVAHTLLWTFLALLIGAFCASYAATIGGRQRDHVVVI